jgi:hypothetical protein
LTITLACVVLILFNKLLINLKDRFKRDLIPWQTCR